MTKLYQFVSTVKSEFPEDRLTWQKSVATFHPESAEEASGFMKLANRLRQSVFITGFGNNIDPQQEPFTSMVSLRTDRFNKLHTVAGGDFYVVCGCGYPLRELNLDLAQEGLFLPHSDLPYVGSVGGAIAVNLSGELNGHDWPIRKYLIRAEIVTPEGEIITPGSACFKSVAGYDIVKMYAPSWGLLGLIVSATFRVLPVSVRDEYTSLKMKAVERQQFLRAFDERNNAIDAVYCRKLRSKFDPNSVLPLVSL